MKHRHHKTSAAIISISMLMAGVAAADEPIPYTQGDALLKRYQCDACHAAYSPSHGASLRGPSLHDIARRYAADPTAQQEVETMVLNGSTGVWGTDSAMAPNAVPQSDLHTLIEWILSLR